MSIWKKSAVFCLVVVLAAGSSDAEIRFKHHFIDDDGPEGEIFANTVLGDVDKDGHADVIVGRAAYGQGPQTIYWYRNLTLTLSPHDRSRRSMACGERGLPWG